MKTKVLLLITSIVFSATAFANNCEQASFNDGMGPNSNTARSQIEQEECGHESSYYDVTQENAAPEQVSYEHVYSTKIPTGNESICSADSYSVETFTECYNIIKGASLSAEKVDDCAQKNKKSKPFYKCLSKN